MESFLKNRPVVQSGNASKVVASSFPSLEHTDTQGLSEKDQKLMEVPWSVASGASCDSQEAPQVKLVMEGERVVKILVNCPCGQSIALACDY